MITISIGSVLIVLFFLWLYTALESTTKVNAEVREGKEIVRRSRAAYESELERAKRSVVSDDWSWIDGQLDLNLYERQHLKEYWRGEVAKRSKWWNRPLVPRQWSRWI
jgi:hypothetical protein